MSDIRANTDRYRVQALARGLAVLACFKPEQPTLRMTDVVEMTGLTMPTVFRLVRTLIGEGYIEELDDGTLRPGLAVMQLGFSAVNGLDVVQAADSRLRTLAASSQETVNLAVREHTSIIYLIRIKNRDLVTADLRVGSRLPIHSSSMGKLLLAYTSEVEREHLLSAMRLDDAEGPNAIRELSTLKDELARIRDRGWSFQDQELAFGLRSIAAPVTDSSQNVLAAINVAVAAHRYSLAELVDRHLAGLLSCASAISLTMGGRLPGADSMSLISDPGS